MNARLIQEQVPLDSQVKFVLQGGGAVLGKLVEIGREHLKIEVGENQPPVTIPMDRVSYWQPLTDTSDNGQNDADAGVDAQPGKPLAEEPSAGPATEAEEKPETEQAENSNPDALSDAEVEIEKKLVEIETRFRVKCQSAKIEIQEPDFKFPEEELSDKQKRDAAKFWDRVRNKYQHAKKINELSSTFGRIQPIVSELKDLAKRFPNSASIKRHLAYLYWLSGNRQDALNFYRETAVLSQDKADWYNLAVVAREMGNEEVACYSLGQIFQRLPISSELEAWHLYIHLLLKFSGHKELILLCQPKHRKISQEEIKLLLEAAVYLLKTAGQETTARETLRKFIDGETSVAFLQKVLSALDRQPTENYQNVTEEISRLMKQREDSQEAEDQPPRGHIYRYNTEKGYGFIREQNGTEYFFHISEITGSGFLKEVEHFIDKPIPVNFQATKGHKGLQAIRISRYRTIHDLYELAEQAADAGNYAIAISYIKQVLLINKNYPNAQSDYEKWREYAKVSGIPKGSNAFALAKRAQLLDKDLDKAEHYFRQAILQKDNFESAVNDLAMLLAQLERLEDAVKVIEQNRSRVHNKQSLDNVLTNIYRKADMHDKAIVLLRKQLRQTQTQEKKDMIQWQIATSCLALNKYEEAEKLFREILKRQPDRISAKRNLALCLSRQERYDEAEDLLNQILAVSSDAGSAAILEAVLRAKQIGERELVDDIAIETELSDYSSGQISTFTQFFLDRCDFTGVPPERVQSKTFRRSDIDTLINLATELGTKSPSERADYYLSASKIEMDIESEDTNRFYIYLCRCFASRGKAANHFDAVREWYAEALYAYDRGRKAQRHIRDEQDAVNALVGFLYSLLEQKLPHSTPTIDDTVNEVIKFADPKRIFDDITYLIFRSRYAASRLLNRLYNQLDLREKALQYLKHKGVQISGTDLPRNDFIFLWDKLSDKLADEIRVLRIDLRHFNTFQLTTAWLEHSIEQAEGIVHRLPFDLDQERIRHLQAILGRGVEMCKEVQFEARERLCKQIDTFCSDLLKEIETSPTRISVEMIHPIIENIQIKISEYLDEIYETSKPELTLSMPVEDYSGHQSNIEVEIVIKNKLGCSPAEGLELVVNKDEESFVITYPQIKLEESLLGGNSHNFTVPLKLTNHALQSEAFSLSAYAKYRTSTGTNEKTDIENFTIRLYSADEFQEIINPYNEGPVVSDPEMFYGRDRMIENIVNSIREAQSQNKCVVIYGQKRSGKSSILYHLEKSLEAQNLMILNLGNIGGYLDEHSKVPFSHQILRQILVSLENAIEDRVDDGFSELDISFPSGSEFYGHPTPMILFKEVFNTYQRRAAKQADWRDVQLVLFIDEFSYIYGQILAGHLSESFMKNWKALMQANYFNAVLVGQDVMERFIEAFQNEFGIAQRERVTYLDEADAKKLIVEPILIGGVEGESRYREPRAIERILELTAGSPFYIQMFCNRLVEHLNQKRAIYVTYSYVEHVRNELMRGRNALALSNFENLYNSGENNKRKDEDVLKILKTIASKTGLCHRSHIDCETELPSDDLLDELVDRDVINREQKHYYTIKVSLFKEWLIANE